jgi:hypothetical protein
MLVQAPPQLDTGLHSALASFSASATNEVLLGVGLDLKGTGWSARSRAPARRC